MTFLYHPCPFVSLVRLSLTTCTRLSSSIALSLFILYKHIYLHAYVWITIISLAARFLVRFLEMNHIDIDTSIVY
jgi:hypothetical protein